MHQSIVEPSIALPIEHDLISGYNVYMAVVNRRLDAIYDSAEVFQTGHQTLLLLVGTVLMHCSAIKPSGVADLLTSSLNDEIDILRIGTGLTS